METGFDDKSEVAKHWDAEPCGAVAATAGEPGSAEWYASIRRSRYGGHASQMPRATRSSDWHRRVMLEIGFRLGSDDLSSALAEARVHVLEVSRDHHPNTTRHLAARRIATVTRLGDGEMNPFRDASFDLVYSFNAPHRTPGMEQAIAAVFPVERPSGTALLGLPEGMSWVTAVRTLLWQVATKLMLLRKGWCRLLSEIHNWRVENDAVPLVKVRGRRDASRPMRDTENVSISTWPLEPSYFTRFALVIPCRFSRAMLERWFGVGGPYLAIGARRPGAG